MLTVVNLNGKIVNSNKAKVSIFDHGFLYGDSIYETLVTYNGHPFYTKDHLKRLYRSAKAVHIKPSWSIKKYESEINKTLQPFIKNKKEAMVRITLTRGVGPIGLDPDLCKKPTNIILAQEFKGYPKKYYTQGVHVCLTDVQRNSPAALNPAIKSCNNLNNILAFIEAKRKGAYDGVMLNYKGYIAEGTTSNIFIIKNGVLKTPKLDAGILEGITRKLVFKAAKKNKIKISETNLKPADLFKADECFITSTTKEIMPVTKCDKKKIAGGKVGPLTKTLLHSYQAHVQKVLSSL